MKRSGKGIAMDVFEAMKARHSVRRYTDRKIEENIAALLREEIDACNCEGGLRIQLILDEPLAFGNILAHYGLFKGVKNYIALVGKSSDDLDERVGYYGERIVLKAQMLGLNTCWVAATYSRKKSRIQVDSGEKVVCVIALGYGANQGRAHRNRPMEALYKVPGEMPDWFQRGVEAAMLAPTAVNQQRFLFVLCGDHMVRAEAGKGSCTKIDLGIVKYHFEIGAGMNNFQWAEN